MNAAIYVNHMTEFRRMAAKTDLFDCERACYPRMSPAMVRKRSYCVKCLRQFLTGFQYQPRVEITEIPRPLVEHEFVLDGVVVHQCHLAPWRTVMRLGTEARFRMRTVADAGAGGTPGADASDDED